MQMTAAPITSTISSNHFPPGIFINIQPTVHINNRTPVNWPTNSVNLPQRKYLNLYAEVRSLARFRGVGIFRIKYHLNEQSNQRCRLVGFSKNEPDVVPRDQRIQMFTENRRQCNRYRGEVKFGRIV